MNLIEYFRVAFDMLTHNKVRSALTMLGVIIGVTAVILLISLGEAAQRYVQNEFADMGSNLLYITPGKQETSGFAPLLAGSFRKLTNENAKEIRHRAEGVEYVAPMVVGAGASRYGGRQRNTMVFGVTADWQKARGFRSRIGRSITYQDDKKNSPVAVLGRKVKQDLFGSKNALHERISINHRKFLVVGIMEPIGMTLGMNMDDIVYIPLSASQQMFHRGEDELFQIVISTKSSEDVPRAKESIREILTAAHDYTEDFTITDQASILDSFDRIFNALTFMLTGLASISLLVGGIGIMNIMLVSVRERTREVGIRKAVGATRRAIGMQFLVESVTISAAGGLAGIVVGYLGTFLLRSLYPVFPVYTSSWSIGLAFVFSVTVGIFFGVYPALKATSVDPVEALRYE